MFNSPASNAAGVPVLDSLSGSLIPDTSAVYPQSEYSLKEITPADIMNLAPNVVKYKDGGTIHYYEVEFKSNPYGTGPNTKYYKWSKENGVVKLVETTDSSEAVLTVNFGARISVPSVDTIEVVDTDFCGQDITGAMAAQGTIHAVTSDFIGNSINAEMSAGYYGYSAVLAAHGGTIGTVAANFIGNSINITGSGTAYGTLVKSIGTINNVTSEFAGNNVTRGSGGMINGGLVEVSETGHVEKLNSDFVLNNVTNTGGDIQGGMLSNEGTITEIKGGSYLSNSTLAAGGNIQGGVIWNKQTIGGIKDTIFSGNTAKSESGNVYGGAVYNELTITNGIVNTVFIENIAESQSGTARGGAIYTDTSLKISADNGVTEFTGNKVINNGTDTNEAVYVGNSNAALTLNAENGGSLILNDLINGARGYNVVLSGGNNGTIYLNENISNANIRTLNAQIDTADGNFFDYDFLSLATDNNSTFKIDVDFINGDSDTFKLGSGSSGTIVLNELNYVTTPSKTTMIQILTGPDSISIGLSEALAKPTVETSNSRISFDAIEADTLWSKEYYRRSIYDETTSGVRVAITDSTRTTADSLEYYIETETKTSSISSLGDTLMLVNRLDSDNRSFKAQSVSDTYNVRDNLGETGSGTLTVSGVRDGARLSTIDGKGFTLFEVNNDSSDVVLGNVKITNSNTQDGSIFNITNGKAEFIDTVQIESDAVNGIINNGTIVSSGTVTINTGITGTGTTEVTGGTLRLNDGASISQTTTKVTGGTLELSDTSELRGALEIASGGSASFSASVLKDSAVNDGAIHLTGGTLAGAITSGSGTTYIDGNVTSNALISNLISMAIDTSLTTDASYIGGEVSGLGKVNLTGGTLGKQVSADYATITGDVTLTNTLSTRNTITVNSGASLTGSASYIGGNVINNAIMNFTGGTLNYETTGNGNIVIDGLWVGIAQNVLNDITINENSFLCSYSADYLKGDIVNNGRLQLDGGILNAEVTGVGQIEGVGNVTMNTALNQELVVKSGEFDVKTANVGADITVEGGSLVLRNGGTVNNNILGSDSSTIIAYGSENIYINGILSGGYMYSSGVAGYASVYINADNFKIGSVRNASIFFTGGTYSGTAFDHENSVSPSIFIVEGANVTINSAVKSHGITLRDNSTLNISADNILNSAYFYFNNSTLNLGSGNLSTNIYLSSGSGNKVNIVGDVTVDNNNIQIAPDTVITENGELTANISQLYHSLTNNGIFNTSGLLDKSIAGTGTTNIIDEIKLNNEQYSIEGTLNLNNGKLTIDESKVGDYPYNLGKVTGMGYLSLNIDAVAGKYSRLQLNQASDGIFNIQNINWVDFPDVVADGTSWTYQILSGDSNAQLAMDTKLLNFNVTDFSEPDTISANVYFNTPYNRYTRDGVLHAQLEIETTQSTNDSLKLTVLGTDWGEMQTIRGALLTNWNRFDTTENKNFNFITSSDKYALIEDIGTSKGVMLNINGVSSVDADGNILRSTIDMNGYGGFRVDTGTTLNIYNTEIIGSDKAPQMTDAFIYSTIGLYGNMGYLDENGEVQGGIVNTVIRDTALTGTLLVDSHSGSVLSINGNILQVKDSEFLNNGTLYSNDGTIKTTNYSGAILFKNGTIGTKDTLLGGIINTTFRGNYSGNADDGMSSADILNGSALTLAGAFISNIKDSFFSDNHIDVHQEGNARGAALFVYGSSIQNIDNTLFDNNYIKYYDEEKSVNYSSLGAAMYNAGKIGTISNSTFSNNYMEYPVKEFDNNMAGSYGAAIYNSGTIDLITDSKFLKNISASYGGAIANVGIINKITNTKFIGNEGSTQGAALYNTGAIGELSHSLFENNKVKNDFTADRYFEITGVFTNNGTTNLIEDVIFQNNYYELVQASNKAGYGTVITNPGTLGNIKNVQFIGNVAYNPNFGLFYNRNPRRSTGVMSGTIFKDNTLYGQYMSVIGGAFANRGRIDGIQDTKFINTTVYAPRDAYGAALANYLQADGEGYIGEIRNVEFTGNSIHGEGNDRYFLGGAVYWNGSNDSGVIVNSIFKDNFISKEAGTTSVALGGAIYVGDNKSLTLKAEGADGLTEVTNNYVANGDNKSYQGIYLSNNAALTLDAKTGGHVLLNDYISGASRSSVHMTGDLDSTISLYNKIENSAVTVDNVNVDMANGETFNYNFSILTSDASANYLIDIDIANGSADTFTIGNTSTGTITINGINAQNKSSENKIIQIIKGVNSNTQLALGDNLQMASDILLTLKNVVYDNDNYNQTEGYELATQNTLNDSIKYYAAHNYDNLALITESKDSTREFVFKTDNTYNLTTDIGNAGDGNFTITGKGDGSTIDANGHNLFKINKGTLSINNTKLTGVDTLIHVTSDYAGVELKNAYIDGKITGDESFHIDIAGDKTTELRGTLTNALTTLTGGTLLFNKDTFSNEGNTLTVDSGSIDFQDGNILIYSIDSLTSSGDAEYSIDVDLNTLTADKIAVNTANSSGVVNIKNINFLNDLNTKESFKIQILDTKNNNNLTLNLSETLDREILDSLSRTETDSVKQTTTFTDTYNQYLRNGRLVGDWGLGATSTTNDSLAFNVSEEWEEDRTLSKNLGDTLNLVINSDYDEKHFVSNSAADRYNVTEDLDAVTDSTLIINGQLSEDDMSFINMQNHKGLEAGEGSSLTISDVRLANAKDNEVIRVSDASAQVTLDNVYVNGNITGETGYNLNLQGQGTTTITGTVTNGTTVLNNGSLSFGVDTFADSTSYLSATSGTISFANDEIENYNINRLTSGESSLYTIDVDLEQQIADTITVGTGSSGIIKLSAFNITGGLSNVDLNKDYTIRILRTENDNIQLGFSESLNSQLDKVIELGKEYEIIDNPIKAVTSFDEEYNVTQRAYDILGKLSLGTSENGTTNDSLHLYDLKRLAGVVTTDYGDTLKLLNQFETTDARRFEFKTSSDRYTVKDNLGSTAASSSITIAGISGTDADNNLALSTIDMNKKMGFEVDNDGTELTIENVLFTNMNTRDGSIMRVTSNNAVINMSNVIVDETTSTKAIENAGTINMTDGIVKLNSGIDGDGVTNITGADVSLKESLILTQETVNVEEGSLTVGQNSLIDANLKVGMSGTATLSASGINRDVLNDGNLNFTGGVLTNNITGNGTTKITGDVINNSIIAQNTDIQNGSLTTTAENVTGSINNGAQLNLSGNLTKTVTGSGTTVVNETLTLGENVGIEGILDLNNGKIITEDNKISEYNIGEIQNNGTFNIDMNLSGDGSSDKFITGNTSNGQVYIEAINFVNGGEITGEKTIQVLKTNGTDNLQLALSDELTNEDIVLGRTSRNEEDTVKALTNYSEDYHTYERGGDVLGSLNLGQKDTLNDSVTVKKTGTNWDQNRTETGLMGDTLALWNQLETDEEKIFTLDENADYTVGERYENVTGLGQSRGKNLTISGQNSTVDLNGKTGFELSDTVNLNIENTKLTGNETLITVSDANAKINLKDSYIDGNITGTENYNVTIAGENTTTLNGKLTNAETTMTGGTLKFNTDTFADTSDSLNTSGGTIALNNNIIESYIINAITSKDNASYTLDINFADKKADTITTNLNSSGIITLTDLNILGELSGTTIDRDYKVQILKTQNSDLQLALSNEVQSELSQTEYLMYSEDKSQDTEVKAENLWTKKYYKEDYTINHYGKLGLATTDTANDSIGVNETRTDVTGFMMVQVWEIP